MKREIDRQQKREPVKKKALVQITEGAEPTEGRRKKNNSGEVTEQ